MGFFKSGNSGRREGRGGWCGGEKYRGYEGNVEDRLGVVETNSGAGKRRVLRQKLFEYTFDATFFLGGELTVR